MWNKTARVWKAAEQVCEWPAPSFTEPSLSLSLSETVQKHGFVFRMAAAEPSHTSPEGQQEVNHGTVVFFLKSCEQ